MNAVWYERQGSPLDVLEVGTMSDPEPGLGEVRILVKASGINPGDLKKRQDAFGLGMPYPKVVPHSDGAGVIDAVGVGVPAQRLGQRVWCFGAQSYRPFGTAAEYVVVPESQAIPLPVEVPYEHGACLGIPMITAHRWVHAAGPIAGRTVLVQGAAGAVGSFAVGLARRAGARVLATVRSDDALHASQCGAHEVVRNDGRTAAEIATAVRGLAPDGVDHVVEVAFDANIEVDTDVLALGGSIPTFATLNPVPTIPFWSLLFKNIHVHFLGSDDIPQEAKRAAALEINAMLESGWRGILVERTHPLDEAARAHMHREQRVRGGRVLLRVGDSTFNSDLASLTEG